MTSGQFLTLQNITRIFVEQDCGSIEHSGGFNHIPETVLLTMSPAQLVMLVRAIRQDERIDLTLDN